MAFQRTQNNAFIHAGTVSSIAGNSIVVSLDQNVQCDSCRAKSACGVADSKAKEVVVTDPGQAYALNEQVEVVLKKGTGLKAVFWAYVFPFLLLTTVLLVASSYLEEWLAGLMAIGVLAPYYLLIHWLNNSFKEKFRVSVQKKVWL